MRDYRRLKGTNDNPMPNPMGFWKKASRGKLTPEVVKLKRQINQLEILYAKITAAAEMEMGTVGEYDLWLDGIHPRQIAAEWSMKARKRIYGHPLGARNGKFID